MGLDFNKTEFETSFGEAKQLSESDAFEIVFAGRSNVGKSSLLNKIFRRKSLARTSSKPGKTATINFYRTQKDVVFVDLPGYGYAKVSKKEKQRWDNLILGYLTSDRNIVLVTLLLDSRHEPSKQDKQMIKFMIDGGYPFVIALTKVDKLSEKALKERMESFADEIPYFSDIKIIKTSAETGEGIDELRETYNLVTEYIDEE